MNTRAIIAAVAMASAAPAAAVELLVNGGFETGDTTGWFNPQHLAVGGADAAHSGTHGLVMPLGEGSLGQFVNTNIGDSYVLSFWVSVPAVDPTRYREIALFVAAANLQTNNYLGYPVAENFDPFPYRQFVSQTYVADSNHSFINIFTSNTGYGPYHSPADWYVDDVSFTGPAYAYVPEPGVWALLIAGFGLTGAALRRKRATA